MLSELSAGGILVADCYLCTYFIVAACQLWGVEIVMKNHHKRQDDPFGVNRLSKSERLVTWLRPDQPDWMSDQEYATMPERVVKRLVDVIVTEKGFRPDRFTIATTVLDRANYLAKWIRSIYQSRWLVELDIRSIKCSLGMDILRGKSLRWCGPSCGFVFWHTT